MANGFGEKRKELVQGMKQNGYLKSQAIENAFLEVERHAFFPKEMMEKAYEDNAFPVGHGQTISQPSTIAAMLEMLDAREEMKILEIGSGTGYVIALLSRIAGEKGKVFGIDLVEELIEQSKKTLLEQKTKNIEIAKGNGRNGWKENVFFDRILVSAACSRVPEKLFEQLKESGKLVAPIGDTEFQELIMFEKKEGKIFERERHGYFVFVPLKEEAQSAEEEREFPGVT